MKAELFSETQSYSVWTDDEEKYAVVMVEHNCNCGFTEYSVVSGEPPDWDYAPYKEAIIAAVKKLREEDQEDGG